jgi:PadR family transcriptional regulator, regulatory protein PadR
MRDPADREIRLAFWKLHVLHHAERQPVWGLWMLRELEEHGHHLSPGTLYPLLARLERNGWLRASPGDRAKARRSYRTTAAGKRLLRRLRAEITELYREVVLGEQPRPRAPRRERTR